MIQNLQSFQLIRLRYGVPTLSPLSFHSTGFRQQNARFQLEQSRDPRLLQTIHS